MTRDYGFMNRRYSSKESIMKSVRTSADLERAKLEVLIDIRDHLESLVLK